MSEENGNERPTATVLLTYFLDDHSLVIGGSCPTLDVALNILEMAKRRMVQQYNIQGAQMLREQKEEEQLRTALANPRNPTMRKQ